MVANQERVKLLFEGRVKRLEKRLEQFQEGGSASVSSLA